MMQHTAANTRRLARIIRQAEYTINTNADALMADLERLKNEMDSGRRLPDIHAQRRDDINRAIHARQSAWDTAAMLGINENTLNAEVHEA